MSAESTLRTAVTSAALDLGAPADFAPVLERPRDPSFGDWATNAAMVLARHLKRKPLDIAHDLVARLDLASAGVREAYAAPPGFINFRLEAGTEAQRLADIVAAGPAFGRTTEGAQRAVNVEFVSANPTGPLHVGHGRQAALGDAVATLLEWTGWKVTREFYYNDAGVQIANLALSVRARVRELGTGTGEIPESPPSPIFPRSFA